MKILLSLVLGTGIFAFSLAKTTAQTTPENPTRSMQQDSQPASLANSVNQGEKKIAGCLRQERSKFVLENGHRKIWLSGPEDFASHAGHAVALYGNFLSTSASASGANTDTKTDGHRSNQGSDFQVTKIEMVSATCKDAKSKGFQSSGQR
jgi:hypothetical protein